jgi:hypothetical protein
LSLVADENFDGQIVELLRSEGHDVLFIAESYSSIGDKDVLRKSLQADALRVTADRILASLYFARDWRTPGYS